jgi:hypothetical protein
MQRGEWADFQPIRRQNPHLDVGARLALCSVPGAAARTIWQPAPFENRRAQSLIAVVAGSRTASRHVSGRGI